MEHGTRLSTLEVNAELAGLIYPAQSLKDMHAQSSGARICSRSSKRAEHGKAGSGSWGVDVPDPLSHLLLGEEAGQP